MSVLHCRAHPTGFVSLPWPPLWVTSFASWHGLSVSSLSLILQNSNNFLSFHCPVSFFLLVYLENATALLMSVQLRILPFCSGVDLAFRDRTQTPHPMPQPCGFTLFPGHTYGVKGWVRTTTSASLLMQLNNIIHFSPKGPQGIPGITGPKGEKVSVCCYGVWYVFEGQREEGKVFTFFLVCLVNGGPYGCGDFLQFECNAVNCFEAIT